MKNTLLFSVLLAALGACQKEEMPEVQTTAYPQTWQLVKSTASWTNTVQTGAALPWQENYVFQADSTFTKTRQQNGQSVDAHGTFSVRTSSGEQYTILTYNAANNLISACNPVQLKEVLVFKPNDTLVSTWDACDGLRLEYQQVAQKGQ